MATSTLKILREINNYTQDYIAEKILGISQNTYSRIEQNPGRINAEQAQKLSELYSVSIANLLSEATPVITFKDSIVGNTQGNGYVQANHNHFHDEELEVLKKELEFFKKQNSDLLQLLQSRDSGHSS